MDFLNLDPLIRSALQEDVGRGDLTTEAVAAVGDRTMVARVLAKEPLVVAGWPVFARVFSLLGDVAAESRVSEGAVFEGGVLGQLAGPASTLLTGERVALNFLQRCCGIASQTREWVNLVQAYPVRLLDTRKTTPLLRSLEKYAVRMGGGFNHRMGLDDAVLIKENHIRLAGGLSEAVVACRTRVSHLCKIEVEVQTLDQLEEALSLAVEIVMLDNFSPAQAREAVEKVGGRCLIEASGGITRENLLEYAPTGVDFISIGALTHSFRSSDISLLLD